MFIFARQMKLNKGDGDDTIVKEEIDTVEAQPDAKRPRRSSLPETSSEKAEITKDTARGSDDEEPGSPGDGGRQSLADRIIERIRRALSPRSDGRTTDHEADDESESDIEQLDGKEIDVDNKDKSITDKEKKDKDKKRTKRMKKHTKDKDKKLKAKKKKKPKTASKDKDDVSDKIEYAKEYPEVEARLEATTEGETTDLEAPRPTHVKKEAVEKALASAAGTEPPPLPDISPPKSPEHQVTVTVEGEAPTVDTSGRAKFFKIKFYLPNRLNLQILLCAYQTEII